MNLNEIESTALGQPMIEPSCEIEGHDKALRPRETGRFVILALLLSVTALEANAAGQSVMADLHEEPITESDRDHWAFKPLVRVPPPDRFSIHSA